jgi:hypothetical protein
MSLLRLVKNFAGLVLAFGIRVTYLARIAVKRLHPKPDRMVTLITNVST